MASNITIEQASLATGIVEKIDKANQRYYQVTRGHRFKPPHGYHYLNIAWKDEVQGRAFDTRHPVVYFLNPYELTQYNSGWFTVEELEDWLQGKGPIVRRAA